MPSELSVRAVHEGGLRMIVSSGEHEVVSDYPLRPGEQTAGLKPMELLLASLAACSGSVVALLLGRMGQPVAGLEVEVKGERRDDHPTVFTRIAVTFTIHGSGVDKAKVDEAIAQADARLCPVWAMLKPATRIETTVRVSPEPPEKPYRGGPG